MWYQSGLVGAPPFEAMTTTLSPSVVYTTGVVRSLPDLAPVVVINTSGALPEHAGDLTVVGAELVDRARR